MLLFFTPLFFLLHGILMTSYTSAFKAVLLALLVIVTIEVLLAGTYTPELTYNSGFFSYKYISGDVGSKRLLEHKIRSFYHTKAEFIQVGDSSGYHGVQPDIIGRYIGGKHLYINGSCCGDTGFAGYRYLAEIYLRNALAAKYLVLYMTPYCMPMHMKEGVLACLHPAFTSPSSFVYDLLTGPYLKAVTNYG